MPTYGYHCPRCDAEFEIVQRMTDDPGAECPRCGTPGRRLFFPAGIVFKGSGFYKTDSRRAASASVDGRGAGAVGIASGTEKPSGAEKSDATEKSPAGERAAASEKAAASDGARSGTTAAAGDSAPTATGASGAGKPA